MIKSPKIKIAIASGKGGTGKTLVSTNLFYALKELNYKVSLVDCDAEEPNDLIFFKGTEEIKFSVNKKLPVINENNCTYCGKCHEYCNYNAIFIIPKLKTIKVMEDLCHGCGACTIACKYDAINEKDDSLGTVARFSITKHTSIIEARMKIGVFSPVFLIKAAIRETVNDKIVILDSPPGTSCPFIQTVDQANYVILVTEPTPFGLSDLKQSVETLKILNKTYGVIINRAGLGDDGVSDYLKKENIPLLMEIPFDKTIASQYSNGELINQFDDNRKAEFISMFNLITNKYGNSSN